MRDPAVKRSAVAHEAGTTVLVVGAKRGEAFRPSAWESRVGASPCRTDEAVRAIEDWRAPSTRTTLRPFYNLACAESRAGDGRGARRTRGARSSSIPKACGSGRAGDVDLDPIRAEVSAITG